MKTRAVLFLILFLILFIGLTGLLKYYFKESNSVIAVIIAAGLFFGLLGGLFIGFVNPPRWLFRLRFIVYEIGIGIMIGLTLFFSRSLNNQTFIISDLVKFLIIASILAIIWGGSRSYIKFRNLKKKTFDSRENRFMLSDSASYKDSSGKIFIGRLLLTNDRLIFLSARDNECLYDPKLTEIIPTIERSKFLKIPRGLNLLPNETKIYVRFPNYWLKAIENEKANATHYPA